MIRLLFPLFLFRSVGVRVQAFSFLFVLAFCVLLLTQVTRSALDYVHYTMSVLSAYRLRVAICGGFAFDVSRVTCTKSSQRALHDVCIVYKTSGQIYHLFKEQIL